MQTIPEEIGKTIDTLQKGGFEAYLVGGCVRDILRGGVPKDWDITTSALPEEIESLFPHTFYENEFGTVGVVIDETEDPILKVIEVTTYRLEGAYSDKRRPDSVTFGKKIEDDLKRRDFTINAMALGFETGERNITKAKLVDPYSGMDDLKNGVIRAVGDPKERFGEDALRILRAIRFISELGFEIEKDTKNSILSEKEGLAQIAKERIRDEFIRIIEGSYPKKSLEEALELGLISYIAPELTEGTGVEQGGIHKYDVFDHLLRSLQHASDKNHSTEVRLAALFHDIAKPHTKRKREKGQKEFSFFGHEVVGARITKKILNDLRFPKEVVDKVVTLVRWHMFFMDTEEITLSAVRRMVANVGEENIWELMNLRTADRIGSGRPKERSYRLRKYESMIEEALRSPVSVGQLKIDGNKIMEIGKLKPGPEIGWVLHALLEEVLDDPQKNTDEYLEKRTLGLLSLPKNELKKIGEAGKEKVGEEEEKEIEKLRKKYGVK